jgi:glycosyltransferase involved in cell wall biosynthesis
MPRTGGVMGTRISAVINTLNEERNLPFALRSVQDWVDEIVVVDMHSEDATRDIAKQYGARVFLHERLGYADPARAFALEQAVGDWILLIDADELIPAPLSERLRRVAATDEYDVVEIPYLNYLLGAPMWHTGWGPTQDCHQRFFRRGAVAARPNIHAFLETQAGSRLLKLGYEEGLAIVHFNYVGISHFVEKLNRYTDIEARQIVTEGRTPSSTRAMAWAAREVWRRYIRQRGFRDGWRGLYLSVLMGAYRFVAVAKAKELECVGPADTILETYGLEAERWLAGYGPFEQRD